MYQVGSVQVLQDNDPTFIDYWDAETYALEKSADDSIYGIWVRNGDDVYLDSLVFQGEVFSK